MEAAVSIGAIVIFLSMVRCNALHRNSPSSWGMRRDTAATTNATSLPLKIGWAPEKWALAHLPRRASNGLRRKSFVSSGNGVKRESPNKSAIWHQPSPTYPGVRHGWPPARHPLCIIIGLILSSPLSPNNVFNAAGALFAGKAQTAEIAILERA